MSQNDQPTASPPRQTENAKSLQKDKAPDWLEAPELSAWKHLSDWRSAFQREKSKIENTLLTHTLRTNGAAILISLVIAALITQTMPGLHFTSSTLTSVANISCITAASLTAIILAFVVFLLGRAGALEDQAGNALRHEVHILESVRHQIGEVLHAKIKESVTDPSVRAKLEDLKNAAKKFDVAINELVTIFPRAARGTFYNQERLAILSPYVVVTGGNWCKTYRRIFPGPDGRDFAIRLWNDATRASHNICRLNDDFELAETQHQNALRLFLALPSLLFVVVLALATILLAQALAVHERTSGFLAIWLTIALIVLLATHVFLLVRWAWQLVYRQMIIRRANRECDREFWAKTTKLDELEMLKATVELYGEHKRKFDETS